MEKFLSYKIKYKFFGKEGLYFNRYISKKNFIHAGFEIIKKNTVMDELSKKFAVDYGKEILSFIFDSTYRWPYKEINLRIEHNFILFDFDFGKNESKEVIYYKCSLTWPTNHKTNGFNSSVCGYLGKNEVFIGRFYDAVQTIIKNHLKLFLNYDIFFCYFLPKFVKDYHEVNLETVSTLLFIINYPGMDQSLINSIEPNENGSIEVGFIRPGDDDVYFKKNGKEPDYTKGVIMGDTMPDFYCNLNVFKNNISYLCVVKGKECIKMQKSIELNDSVMTDFLIKIKNTFKL